MAPRNAILLGPTLSISQPTKGPSRPPSNLAREKAAKAAFPDAVPIPPKQGAKSNIFARRAREFKSSPLVQNLPDLGRFAADTGKFAWKHPFLVAGGAAAVGGGLYVAGGGPSSERLDRGTPGYSPTLTGAAMNLNYNKQAAALAELETGGISPMGFRGTAPQFQEYMQFQEQQTYRERLRNSTQGLVQGLNRGRHG